MRHQLKLVVAFRLQEFRRMQDSFFSHRLLHAASSRHLLNKHGAHPPQIGRNHGTAQAGAQTPGYRALDTGMLSAEA